MPRRRPPSRPPPPPSPLLRLARRLRPGLLRLGLLRPGLLRPGLLLPGLLLPGLLLPGLLGCGRLEDAAPAAPGPLLDSKPLGTNERAAARLRDEALPERATASRGLRQGLVDDAVDLPSAGPGGRPLRGGDEGELREEAFGDPLGTQPARSPGRGPVSNLDQERLASALSKAGAGAGGDAEPDARDDARDEAREEAREEARRDASGKSKAQRGARRPRPLAENKAAPPAPPPAASPQAARLGLQPGDRILRVDGVPVGADFTVSDLDLAGARPPVIEISRDGQPRVLYPELPGRSAAGWERSQGPRPERFLPRAGYFENTYLGRSPLQRWRARSLDARFGAEAPYAAAALPPQALDPPGSGGLALSATLDRPALEGPGRVFLQIAIKGSERFGWRRPPLDLVLVVDGGLAAGAGERVTEASLALLRRLDPRDRLAVVVADARGPRLLSPLQPLRDARRALATSLSAPAAVVVPAEGAVARALDHAGALLREGSQGQARIPGSQSVLVLAEGGQPGQIQAARAAAHRLTLQGAVTSVIDLAEGSDRWWPVAQAGHGQDHQGLPLAAALDAELASQARVIARLLRLNLRLAPEVHAVRILGSRMLDEVERREVKAREEATDRQLSQTLGLKADRGADDDGLQVVIPYFFGGDAHLILVELWVDRPGPVAEITLKYKDMVQLDNATARAQARLDARPAPPAAGHLSVRDNVRGFEFAWALREAARLIEDGQPDAARARVAQARPVNPADAEVQARFLALLADGPARGSVAALDLAGQRRITTR